MSFLKEKLTGKRSDEDGHQLSLVKNEAGMKSDYDSIPQHDTQETGDGRPASPTSASSPSDNAKIEEEPIKPLTTSVMVFLTLAQIGQGMCLTSLGPTLLDLRQIAYISMPDTAWLFIAQSIGFFFGGIFAKPLLVRFDNEMAIGICLLIQSACTVFVAAFSSIVIMCIMLAAQGFGIGFVGFGTWILCARLGGKLREGMFLQAIFLGQAVGNVICPLFAHPFMSAPAQNTSITSHGRVFEHLNHLVKPGHTVNETYLTEGQEITNNNQSTDMFEIDGVTYLASKIQYYYVIQALIIAIPAIALMLLYCSRDRNSTDERKIDASQEEACRCSGPVFALAAILLVVGMLLFGLQDAYSNLIPTFAVLSKLRDMKWVATYLPSSFWLSVLAGRLIGIFMAKGMAAITLLLIDTVLSTIVLVILCLLGDVSDLVLWMGTVLLGVTVARMSASSVTAVLENLPANSFYLTMIVIAQCFGVMIIPSTVVAAMKIGSVMSLLIACISCIGITLVLLIIAKALVQRFGDLDGRVHP